MLPPVFKTELDRRGIKDCRESTPLSHPFLLLADWCVTAAPQGNGLPTVGECFLDTHKISKTERATVNGLLEKGRHLILFRSFRTPLLLTSALFAATGLFVLFRPTDDLATSLRLSGNPAPHLPFLSVTTGCFPEKALTVEEYDLFSAWLRPIEAALFGTATPFGERDTVADTLSARLSHLAALTATRVEYDLTLLPHGDIPRFDADLFTALALTVCLAASGCEDRTARIFIENGGAAGPLFCAELANSPTNGAEFTPFEAIAKTRGIPFSQKDGTLICALCRPELSLQGIKANDFEELVRRFLTLKKEEDAHHIEINGDTP